MLFGWKRAVAGAMLLVSAVAAADEGAFLERSKERLDLHLGNVRSWARSGRYLGGGVLLGTGALLGAGAIVASGSSNDETRRTGTLVLGISGGVLALAGAAVILFPSDYEKLPEKYQDLPTSSREQLRGKVLLGEDYLRQLGERSKRQRYIGAGTGLALGAAYIGWYAASSSSTTDRSWLLYTGVAVAGLSVVNFFIETKPEEELRAYREWKGVAGKTAVHWSATPIVLPQGGGLGVALTF